MLRFKWHYHSIGENMLVLALEVHFFYESSCCQRLLEIKMGAALTRVSYESFTQFACLACLISNFSVNDHFFERLTV